LFGVNIVVAEFLLCVCIFGLLHLPLWYCWISCEKIPVISHYMWIILENSLSWLWIQMNKLMHITWKFFCRGVFITQFFGVVYLFFAQLETFSHHFNVITWLISMVEQLKYLAVLLSLTHLSSCLIK